MGKRPGKPTRYPGVRDLGNGQYVVRVVTKVGGKRTERERRIAARSLLEAVAQKAKLEQEAACPPSGSDSLRSSASFGDLAAEWIALRQSQKRKDGSPRLSPATLRFYEQVVRIMLTPYLGDDRLPALTRKRLEDFRDHLAQAYASKTVNSAMTILRLILREHGVEVAVRRLEEDDTKITEDEPNALTEAELERFVWWCGARYPQHLAIVLVLFTTGARISAVTALRWEDIDTEAGTITYRRRLSAGSVLAGVKRGRTARDVAPLLPEVWAELERHRLRLTPEQLAGGWVFPGDDGKPMRSHTLSWVFERLRKLAGIQKRFTVHGCRRTAVNLYRKAAGSVVSKAIVGHTTDAMHEHYSTVGKEEKAEAARGAFKVLKGGGGDR